jgi:hypothetical protein
VPIEVGALEGGEIEKRALPWALPKSVDAILPIAEDVFAKVSEIDKIVDRSYGGGPPQVQDAGDTGGPPQVHGKEVK